MTEKHLDHSIGGFVNTQIENLLSTETGPLAHSDERFKHLANLIGEILFETDVNGMITFVNQCGLKGTGYGPQALANGFPAVNLLVQEDRERGWNNMIAVMQGRDKSGHEYTAIRSDGSTFPVISRSSPVMKNGSAVGIRGILFDLTIHKNYQSALKKAEENLCITQLQLQTAQRMEVIGRLTGGIAHDFNNYLTAIESFVGSILMDIDEKSPVFNDAKAIRQVTQRAAALTRQLLAFSRSQASLQNHDFLPLATEQVDLNDTIISLSLMLERLIGQGFTFVTELESELDTVTANRGLLEQIIINLSLNARDAMTGRNGTMTISTRNARIDANQNSNSKLTAISYVVLTVSDTGTGMDTTTQKMIFEPFFSTKPEDMGTGLGLFTVREIVKQFGGFIRVISEVDHGSSFEIFLRRTP